MCNVTYYNCSCSELRYISQDAFLHLEHGDKELADIAYKHCETVRQVQSYNTPFSASKISNDIGPCRRELAMFCQHMLHAL
jgi:hypothetical protein